MKVEENARYSVILNPNDMTSLIAGKSVTFWITVEGRDDLSFKIKTE